MEYDTMEYDTMNVMQYNTNDIHIYEVRCDECARTYIT